ncbi:methionine--tRNA ligase [Spiroplasma tabanidicola]|uniref:Methionine--tRNA ligase n=1 Tax=Spiroplasma tabanidicola TaxID=324079 RepID=A0A6I6CEN7_9MOLU|nr:methionine--tRNA ligase [Spiroplasma tabanidicola]QGS52444.1 methionyl-tRNA synthetase [Spiroplasma tabanidicola]
MKKTFYVSTPIYYPSGKLHIGHTYTSTLADVMARYKKENFYDVFFLTGSDEHGQKIEQKAKEQNKSPKEYVDEIVLTFKDLWEKLDIKYDRFIRTTDEDHIKAVQKIFSFLLEKDLIFLSDYKGKYCISCEEFLTFEQMDKDFVHNVCKNTAIDFQEETYMLRVSKFQKYLQDLFKTDFLEPESRKNEMLNSFINTGLEDLSVTRVSFKWGIPVLENDKHIIYVWIDALSNYITALGYGSDNTSLLEKFWAKDSEILQIVGKEITRFHSIYWPIILNSLNLKTPDKLLSHGWIISGGNKMSKSLGNVIDPIELLKKYSSDAVRFYIINNLPTDKDGEWTEELFIESFNINLANNIGNLLSRVSNMIIKYFDGLLPKKEVAKNNYLVKIGEETIVNYKKFMDKYDMSSAIKEVLKLSQECNKFIEDTKPWALEKENKLDELNEVLTILQKNIIIISYLLKPILTKSFSSMIEQMGLKHQEINFDSIEKNNFNYKKIIDKLVLFERIKN